MSENLLKEYRERIVLLKDFLDKNIGDEKSLDINLFFSLQSKLEKNIWQLSTILDLLEYNSSEELERPIMANFFSSAFPRTSSHLENMLRYSREKKEKKEVK